MKIFLIEKENNIELFNYLKSKYTVLDFNNLYLADVLIIHKVFNAKEALEIVDYALNMGKEVICIKANYAKEHYVTNYLIKDGANFV